MQLTYSLVIGLILSFQALLAQESSRTVITFFGSSVCKGSGAADDHGYAWQFYHSGKLDTTQYAYANASTGGDNTIKIEKFDRLTNKLYPTDPDMVVIGLSLSNEGIRRARNSDHREMILEQFSSRLRSLADSLNRKGILPVIANCYAQSHFSEAHYSCTRRINQVINTWDYPSINLLGTIDDWRGRWVRGFSKDPGHPNDRGHEEMSYAIVPSLFDALKMGKEVPRYDWNTSYTTLNNATGVDRPIAIDLEHTLHSFTMSFRFRNTANGSIAGFTSADTSHLITIEDGRLGYGRLSTRLLHKGSDWTHVVLAHSYANGQTLFIVDGSLVGVHDQRLAPTQIHFGGTVHAMDIRDLMVHRSCLNTEEATDLYYKKLIQSSLEFFHPLTSAITGIQVPNKAQSLTKAEVHKQVVLHHKKVDW